MEQREGPKIEIAGKHTSVSEMRRMAEEERRGGPTPPEVNIGRLLDTQRELIMAVMAQNLNFEQFLKQSGEQTRELTESLSRLPPEKERERWIDTEYRQEFYTRFTPTMEPRFYTMLEAKDRELWEARWQLARAAFWKRAHSAFPEKQFENQDLQLLKNEQMEKLYKIPGVKEALGWYAREIRFGQTKIEVRRPGKLGKSERVPITILECKDETEFEDFRDKMRGWLKSLRLKNVEDSWQAKEADAVAWNWIWCSNLIESVDSRYSYGKMRHSDLPGTMISDDLRSVLHPQEKYESKCATKPDSLEWGAFGKWGATQIERIKIQRGFRKEEDQFEFWPATGPIEFWKSERTDRESEKGGKIIEVWIPECYPTTSLKSFWEVNKIGEDTLLKCLLDGKEIQWKELNSDPWIRYLPIKLNKAIVLFEYFAGKVPFEEEKDKAWVTPILDAYRRLGLKQELGEEAFHNLKAWAFRASLGGVGKPEVAGLTSPILPHHFWAYSVRLRSPRLGYLKRGGVGDWTGEGLDIK